MELSGTILEVGKKKKVSDKLEVSDFVLKTDDNKYPQEVPFQLLNKKADLIDKLKKGQSATVSFDIWSNKSRDGSRRFINLNCWRLELEEAKEEQVPEERMADEDGEYAGAQVPPSEPKPQEEPKDEAPAPNPEPEPEPEEDEDELIF